MSDPTSPSMPDHLSAETLAAFVDGELTADDLARASQHLTACPACTTRTLYESLLQRSAAHAGQRYAVPESLEARIVQTIQTIQTIAPQQNLPAPTRAEHTAPSPTRPRTSAQGRSPLWPRSSVWAGALAALLLVSASAFVAHDLALRSAHSSALAAALVTESIDEHIAAMAAATPQVVSTDRHTVKPWFQGKLPFSFNLPAALPPDVTLDGANLVQLDGEPTAQLLFSIGKHHASVFLRQRGEPSVTDDSNKPIAEHNGFHVEGFRTSELNALAVSDADPSRLHDLALALQHAQASE